MRYFVAGFLLSVVAAATLGCLIATAIHFAPDLAKDNNPLYVLAGGLVGIAAIIFAVTRLTQ